MRTPESLLERLGEPASVLILTQEPGCVSLTSDPVLVLTLWNMDKK